MIKSFTNKTILVTGGTGTFGSYFIEKFIKQHSNFKKIIIFSRDEFKQYNLKKKLKNYKNFNKVRFFIGDIRDKSRVDDAFREVDIIIHTAALKQIDTAEYNPTEFINTNINGSKNIIDNAIHNNIKKVIFLSTDKACSPVNLYGATKFCAERLFLSANNYVGKRIFTVIRYGNVFGSRGSVAPLFLEQKKNKILTITNREMTRFSIELDECYEMVMWTLKNTLGGEIVIPKLKSYKVTDLAKAVDQNCKIRIIGMRPSEKVHEELINEKEAEVLLNLKKYYIVTTKALIKSYQKSSLKFKIINSINYNSKENKSYLNIIDLKKMIQNLEKL
jgi:FlaA1/EpsC-like NDP-sugar epimerase